MKDEQIKQLHFELRELEEKCAKADIQDPKWRRRITEINSLLLTDGNSAKVDFSMSKGRESQRVTSFTKDRR